MYLGVPFVEDQSQFKKERLKLKDPNCIYRCRCGIWRVRTDVVD